MPGISTLRPTIPHARRPSLRVCELPYTRLDIHTDGHMAVCVSGKRVGQIGRDSIAGVWRGKLMAGYRDMYERTRPMPMCFRCCGLSQAIRFDDLAHNGTASARMPTRHAECVRHVQ